MKTCGWKKRVEALHDGVADDAAKAHLVTCAACAAHLTALERIRAGIQAVRRTECIEDAQFSAFMTGIRREIDETPAPRRGFWAMASLSAAAMVIALTCWSVLRTGFEGPAMTEVEAMETELEGASLEWIPSDKDGVSTLWVNISKEDTW